MCVTYLRKYTNSFRRVTASPRLKHPCCTLMESRNLSPSTTLWTPRHSKPSTTTRTERNRPIQKEKTRSCPNRSTPLRTKLGKYCLWFNLSVTNVQWNLGPLLLIHGQHICRLNILAGVCSLFVEGKLGPTYVATSLVCNIGQRTSCKTNIFQIKALRCWFVACNSIMFWLQMPPYQDILKHKLPHCLFSVQNHLMSLKSFTYGCFYGHELRTDRMFFIFIQSLVRRA